MLNRFINFLVYIQKKITYSVLIKRQKKVHVQLFFSCNIRKSFG